MILFKIYLSFVMGCFFGGFILFILSFVKEIWEDWVKNKCIVYLGSVVALIACIQCLFLLYIFILILLWGGC